MKKGTRLKLCLIRSAHLFSALLCSALISSVLPCSDLAAQPAGHLIDLFPDIANSVSEKEASLFSLVVDGTLVFSREFEPGSEGSFIHRELDVQVMVSEIAPESDYGCRILRIINSSKDTLELENLLPLGPSDRRPFITGNGPPGLTRATLFRPDYGPVGLIVPDNAWEMGFSAVELSPDSGMALLTRREAWKNAERRRYSTILHPGGEVSYKFYTENYGGDWRSALIHLFRNRWLYDVPEFDNHLYEREDLQWIREDYLAVLQFAWDRDFYSTATGSYDPFREFFHRFDFLHGGYDIYAIWQGWPRLGLDGRNQWDLFRDLPGGVDSLRAISAYCRDHGSAFFISFNPWDQSTRKVDHLQEMEEVIRETMADGVVLDTRGSSSAELQKAADQAKDGVVMYSEGMAVPKDMPWIVSGRVHNAIRMSPPLNLNRLIKPEFQVFRVLDLRDGRIRRDLAISLFNGYGVELNLFSPAHPWWLEEEYRFMGRCLMTLRQNQEAFHDQNWVPLVESPDSIWVNKWHHGDKILYTLLSLKAEGYTGPLVRTDSKDLHWISLWDHQEITPVKRAKGSFLDYHIDPFRLAYCGTRSEGSIQVIAGFPELLSWRVSRDSLVLSTTKEGRIVVWKGNPSYSNTHRSEFSLERTEEITLPLSDWMHLPEGKMVVQLYRGKEIMDERIIRFDLATPVRINETQATTASSRLPEGMVEIRGGTFLYYRGNEADFIPYPSNFDTLMVNPGDFYMDRYPVTNSQYEEFVRATAYFPADTVNFLKHWDKGNCPDSLADHPVVWVSLEDARAYARWKGKRLPTEMEWQYAAQGQEGRLWPWGNLFDSTVCNHASGHTSPVHAYPGGRSPFGVEDMTGNVWQLCDDEYFNGSFFFSMIRGGSFYKPTSSWWYIQGGPQPNNHTQMLLKTAPGFDRSEAIGFRCVCDK
jgi:formylglycine-generating enzyme required for sulfatase activity